MNKLEEAKELKWKWKNKEMKLGDMHLKMLSHIVKVVSKNPNKVWFGKRGDFWSKKVGAVLKDKIKDDINIKRLTNIKGPSKNILTNFNVQKEKETHITRN